MGVSPWWVASIRSSRERGGSRGDGEAVGGGAGRLPSGRHIRYDDEPSMANLLVTLMDKMGVPVESHGGSTGALPIDTLTGLLG